MSKTVCVVDDDELLRAYVAQLLEPEGFTIREAGDGNSGLKIIEAHAPFAALVDIIMPDCDGLELIGQIRSRWPDMRIIAMSGGGRLGPGVFLDTAKGLGANACLTKPILAEELMQALQ
jgi:CheY-like chemotaxis protein